MSSTCGAGDSGRRPRDVMPRDATESTESTEERVASLCLFSVISVAIKLATSRLLRRRRRAQLAARRSPAARRLDEERSRAAAEDVLGGGAEGPGSRTPGAVSRHGDEVVESLARHVEDRRGRLAIDELDLVPDPGEEGVRGDERRSLARPGDVEDRDLGAMEPRD